jgi:hypothetical protein
VRDFDAARVGAFMGFYSITSSARARSVGAIVKPRASSLPRESRPHRLLWGASQQTGR